MKRMTLLAAIAACGPGSHDAPRPIAPYPAAAGDFDRESNDLSTPTNDDDNDGIQNEQDGCPLAAEKWDDPVKDGCPSGSPDAGV
jgi:hypothetical protein